MNLLDAHRQFHEEAGKVARMINQGAYDHAEKQLANDTAFSRASQKVATAVIQLAKELKVRLAGSSQAAAAPRPAQPVALASAPRPKVTSAAGDDDWESF